MTRPRPQAARPRKDQDLKLQDQDKTKTFGGKAKTIPCMGRPRSQNTGLETRTVSRPNITEKTLTKMASKSELNLLITNQGSLSTFLG